MGLVSIDASELTAFLKGLSARIQKGFDSKKALTESGRLVASLIKARTKSGRDVDGKPFTPYTRKKGGPDRVDLDSSGEMLDAIEVRAVSDTEVLIGIFDPVQQRKAIIHQLGLGRMPARRFFGVGGGDAETMAAIEQIFAREIGKAVGRI